MIFYLRRFAPSKSFADHLLMRFNRRYCSSSWPLIDRIEGCSNELVSSGTGDASLKDHSRLTYHMPTFWHDQPQLDSREIKVVDSHTWSVSSLANVFTGRHKDPESGLFGVEEVGDEFARESVAVENDPDFDEVEDMRIRGSLFYKIERSSMEFEEYEFDFHGKKGKHNKFDKTKSNKQENKRVDVTPKGDQSLKNVHQGTTKKGQLNDGSLVNKERLSKTIKEKYVVCAPEDGSCIDKKQRRPTYNQLTGPYHEPFCLDIFVSKGSVRACIVHRVTSKVVVVAHSISKDMKFDFKSTKSVSAATAVGKVLAQRALEDDIHDVIYTPRKGDTLEGKLQIVLKSIIDNGINVKVRLKQRNPGKPIRRL